MRFFSVLLLTLFSFSAISQTSKKKIEQAVKLADEKKFSEALVILDKILEKDTINYSALVTRGMIYNDIDSMQNGYDDLTKAIDHYPDSVRAYFFRGLIFFRLQYSEASIVDYTSVLELADNDTLIRVTYMNRGNAKQQMRDFQGGFEDYSRAYMFDTTDIAVLNNLATVLDELGRREEATVYLKKITVVAPEFMGGWVNLGFQHSKMGKHKEALQYLNKAVELDPEEPLALNNRGYTRFMLNDYKGALEDINKSIKLYPANAYAYRNRALVYIAQGDNKKACVDIEAGLSLEYTKVYGDELLELKKKHCN